MALHSRLWSDPNWLAWSCPLSGLDLLSFEHLTWLTKRARADLKVRAGRLRIEGPRLTHPVEMSLGTRPVTITTNSERPKMKHPHFSSFPIFLFFWFSNGGWRGRIKHFGTNWASAVYYSPDSSLVYFMLMGPKLNALCIIYSDHLSLSYGRTSNFNF